MFYCLMTLTNEMNKQNVKQLKQNYHENRC